MDGAIGAGTAGEGAGIGNSAEQGQVVSNVGQGDGTGINGQNGEGNSEGTQEISNFADFNMLEDGETEQNTENDGEEDGESLSLQLFEGEEYSEEDMAQINEYASLAKELGMNENQFNIMFRTVQLQMNKQAIAEIDAQIASEKNSLQTLKSELSLEERTAWQPMARQLTSEYGEETAKAIMLNPNVYRAFLGKNKGDGISIKKNNAPKMTHEQALDARTAELRENLGNDAKVQEILEKYLKEYPEYFEKK
ncbi:MAG: hypothetical protein ACRCXT_14050 [Paraclostridium sp.]